MTDGLALVRARLAPASDIWFARFVLIVTALLIFALAVELSADGVLFVFWRRTLLVFALGAVAIAMCIAAWRLSDSALSRIAQRISPISQLTSRLNLFGFILSAALMLLLFLGPWRASFQTLATRFFVLWLTSLLASSFLANRQPPTTNRQLPTLLFSLLLLTALYNLASHLFMLAPTPYSIGWSEATRYYHASLLLSERYYGIFLPPFYQDLSRYVVEVVPLLLLTPSLTLQRVWEYILRFLMPAITVALLLRRLAVAKQNRILWLALFFWGTLFLLQGPVYFYLLPAAMPVLAFYDSRKPIPSILALLAASFWAGISRINWLPIPAMLTIALYLLEVPANKSILRYLIPPALYTVLGLATAYAARLWYMHIAHIDPAMFNASFIQDLLWYRLFPSSLNAWGILPSGLLMATPLFLFFLAHLRNYKNWHWIRLLGLGAMLVILLAGGIIVSAKIGGGNNLHNLDGFSVLYLTIGLYLLFQRFTPEGTAASPSPTLISPLTLSLAVLAVTVFTSNAVTPALPSTNRHVESLAKLQQLVDETTDGGGSVLFITQRHLLTYNLISGVPLVREYDNIDLMEYAITNYRPMIDQFRADVAAHKYALIIAPIPPGQLRENDSPFSEENNAWLKRISLPMLRSYKILAEFPEGDFVVLIPDE
ncbi:MAG: hypothetical protein HFACDABA_02128 [Anaerolineales bacterium]|nr:hypothetical protein [Anaerolineales bacterium]